MNEHLIDIPGRLHSVAVEKHVAGTDQIYDDFLKTTLDILNLENITDVKVQDGKLLFLNIQGLVLKEISIASEQKQSDWNLTDSTQVDFIKSKPIIYNKLEVDNKLITKQDTIADLATIRSGAQAGATAYQKPSTGIPATDLASAVQVSLGKADTALQEHQSLAGLVNTGSYNTVSKKIELKHDNTVLAKIDATAFIKDGMVSSVTINNGYLVITFNTDAGKEPISIALTDIFNPANYYDKDDVDWLLAGKVDKETGKGLSTNDYTDSDKGKLSALPTNSELTTALAGKQATLTAGNNINISNNVISANNEGWEHAADQFAVSGTTAYGQKKVSANSTLDITDVKKGTFRLYNSVAYNGDMTIRHFKVEAIYTGSTVTLYDVEVGYYETKELSFTANIDGDCTIRVTNGLLRNAVAFYSENAYKEYTKTLATVGTTGSYNDLSDKPTIPTVPTNVSAFTNDAGYLTQHQDITGKADKVSNATNGNFAALDSNGNLIDSGHKHSDYLTEHQDISGKANKNEMSVVPGTGADADKTTITLKQGTSTTVLTAHQDISGKENIMPITTATGATLSAVVGNYYRLDNVGTLAITLPTIVGATKLQAITFLLACGSSALVTFAPQGSETILYQEDFALEADTTYEVTALWNGSEWTLSRVIYE